ncbi:hypothetical protein MEQU1_001849 [Malassezia equina]|uniref:Smr domain-containing protein n=1 Tax=Malassezia equina TaxID=1381935 RepID=A0AAF0EI72_9BASI|nr:hypothetical protein MEQU1_001849 [Malassezia equina]
MFGWDAQDRVHVEKARRVTRGGSALALARQRKAQAGMDHSAALVARFSSRLDPSLILAISQEPGQTHEQAAAILEELAAAVPDDMVSEEGEAPIDTSLLFLQQTFPEKEVSVLQQALEDSRGDVDGAMDELLAQDMLEAVVGAESEAAAASSSQRGLDLEALSEGLASKKPKAKKSKDKKSRGPVTVSLTDQRSPHHILYAARPTPKPATLAPVTVDTAGLNDEEIARRLQNAERDAAEASSLPVVDQQWLLASSTVSQLAVLLGLPSTRVQSLFHQASFNLPIAMGRAIQLAASDPAADAVAQTPGFQTACETLAVITERDVWHMERLLRATRGHQDAALDLLQLEDVVNEAADGLGARPDILDPSGLLSTRVPSAERSTATVSQRMAVTGGAPRWLSSEKGTYAGRASQAPPPVGHSQRAQAALQAGQAVTVLPASAGQVDVPEGHVEDDTPYTREESLRRAADARALRDAALEQAARCARQSRSTGVGGAAMVYAAEARKHDATARRWQLRAASALVEQRRFDAGASASSSDAHMRIDLHGLTVHESLTVVAQSVARWQSTPLGEARVRAPLEIVTGRGMHSRHYQSVIRPAIVRYLTQRHFTVDATSDAGILYVKAKRA